MTSRFKIQDQQYSFECDEHSPTSRKTMYMPDERSVTDFCLNASQAATRTKFAARSKMMEAEVLEKAFAEYLQRFDIFTKA